uniref:Uncharacterized protein n=1 Tax=Salix viminalis TaxID=40686 RepID=A0A6N2KV19_SALVM
MLSLTCPPMYLSGSFLPELAEVYCNDRFQRGLKRKPVTLFEKLREAFDLQLQSRCSRLGFVSDW